MWLADSGTAARQAPIACSVVMVIASARAATSAAMAACLRIDCPSWSARRPERRSVQGAPGWADTPGQSPPGHLVLRLENRECPRYRALVQSGGSPVPD